MTPQEIATTLAFAEHADTLLGRLQALQQAFGAIKAKDGLHPAVARLVTPRGPMFLVSADLSAAYRRLKLETDPLRPLIQQAAQEAARRWSSQPSG